jgi:hypothetical protein
MQYCNQCHTHYEPHHGHTCQNGWQVDASRVFYHFESCEASKLTCLEIPNGTNLQTILEIVDYAICQAITFNYNSYNLPCLRARYTITDNQQFAESVDTELCRILSQVATCNTTVTDAINDLDARLTDLEFPELEDPCDIGFTSADSLKTVLTAWLSDYCIKIAGIGGDTSPTIQATQTASISWILSGTKNHILQANVKISATSGNQIALNSDGLYVALPSVPSQIQTIALDTMTRVVSLSLGGGSFVLPTDPAQTIAFNCTTKVLTLSNGGGAVDFSCVIPPPFVESPITIVQGNGLNIAVSGVTFHTLSPTIVLDPAVNNVATISGAGLLVPAFVQATLVTTDSSSIALVASGTAGHQLTASVIISPNGNNLIATLGNGIYAAETPLVASDSTSIDFTSSGTSGHNLTGFVKISATGGNLISIASDGLYASSPAITADNALTRVANNIQWGGPLVVHTTISGPYDIAYTNGKSIYGSNAVASLGVPTTIRLAIDDVQVGTSSGNFAFQSTLTVNVTGTLGFTIDTNSSMIVNVNSNTVLSETNVVTSNLSALFIGSAASSALTVSQSGSGRVISAITASVQLTSNAGGVTSTVSHVAGIRCALVYAAPGASNLVTMTNYYHLFMPASDDFSVPATNRFGIYQVGANDVNRFFGVVQNAGGTTQFTSDKRVKENITPFIRGLNEINSIDTKKFNYVYNKNKVVTGIIAQELEMIIPEAVEQGEFTIPGDGGQVFNDFRMVDQNILFYTMLNAIKELSTKVKLLEDKIAIIENPKIDNNGL